MRGGADAEFIGKLRPDAVVVATGAKPKRPDIPGANGENVVLANDVLSGRAETGERVVILGGGLIGMETAVFLAKQGKKHRLSILRTLAITSGIHSKRRCWKK